jgi:small neutral amino acid transporter SnatA (MarC family)
MLKNFIAISVGYAIFVISSILLFKLSGKNAHAPATIGFQIITACYGIAFSIISGFVSQLIGNKKTLVINYILAFIIAGFATFSFF